ncbi:hypothetical protein ABGV42_00135 [Paenibacillus pabuli]|uniref:hypothetical protein n=1 Tax=Paenibacillus pabuli TaxID=1472 RepID=UPI003241EFF4
MSNVNEGDWVVTTEDFSGEWSGRTQNIPKGTVGRFTKDFGDGYVAVSFGMTLGFHKMSKAILAPRD